MADPINIEWEGYFDLSELDQAIRPTDMGLFQIYGDHRLYGEEKLLFIGKVNMTSFAEAIPFFLRRFRNEMSSQNTKFCLGRFIHEKNVKGKKWNKIADKALDLLIHSHRPILNWNEFNDCYAKIDNKSHLLNWGNFGSLLSEVSSLRHRPNAQKI